MIKLSIAERQILVNQFEILGKLTDLDEHKNTIEILKNGYTQEYDSVFSVKNEEISIEICSETQEILEMFRNISDSISALNEEEKLTLDLKKLEFQGFDTRKDSHYKYAEFLINSPGLWDELKGKNRNTHTQLTLDDYRKMLKIIANSENKRSLKLPDLKQLIEVL